MSIRPVDFQMLVPKVNDAVRATNEDLHRQVAQQQQDAANANQQAQADTTQVHTREEAQQAQIGEREADRKGGGRRKKAGGNADGTDGDKEEAADRKIAQPNEGRTIDIRI